jgi:hypothetical protein
MPPLYSNSGFSFQLKCDFYRKCDSPIPCLPLNSAEFLLFFSFPALTTILDKYLWDYLLKVFLLYWAESFMKKLSLSSSLCPKDLRPRQKAKLRQCSPCPQDCVTNVKIIFTCMGIKRILVCVVILYHAHFFDFFDGTGV